MGTSIRQLVNDAHLLPLDQVQQNTQARFITPDNTEFDDIPLIDVFLAGGITNCWNWQKPMAVLVSYYLEMATPLTWLIDNPPFVIASPRRETGFSHEGNMAIRQIRWEHKALASSYTKSYYFTRDAMQPISLLELGKHLANPKDIFIAIEDGYCRQLDVRVQSDLALRQAGEYDNHLFMLDHDEIAVNDSIITGATAIMHFNHGNQPQWEQDIYHHFSPYAKMVAAHLLRKRGLDPAPVFAGE